MAAASNRSGQDTVIAARLHGLMCRCGQPARSIHLVDGDTAYLAAPWRRGDTGCDTVPSGGGTCALPACEEHTYFGIGLRVDWLADHWQPWLANMDLKDVQGARAVLELMTIAEDARQDVEAWTARGRKG